MNSLRTKLSFMMFLEFFIWGAWLPLIFGYLAALKFTPGEQGWILNAFAISSLVGMFFSNQFADRYFAAEKFLAVSHLIGGLAIIGLAFTTSFWPFFILMLVHSLFYVPTISITNSIAFASMKDAQNEFALVRRWGTIGWIAASWPFIFLLADWAKIPAIGEVGFVEWLGKVFGTPLDGEAKNKGVALAFIVSGAASLLLAAFSLLLPHTPPKKQNGGESFALLESLKLLQTPFIMVLFLVTFLDAMVHQCYFIFTDSFLQSIKVPGNWSPAIMSIGQIAEIVTMTILGVTLSKLGWRTTMILGILGHVVRFGLFALVPIPAVAITVNILHGVCYAFFFATLYIFIDEYFPKDARTSSQGLFNLLVLGVGPFVGNIFGPWLGGRFTIEVKNAVPEVTPDLTKAAEVVEAVTRVPDYKLVFLTLSGIGLVAALLLGLFFHPPKIKVPEGAGH